jgi:hypothetical protein
MSINGINLLAKPGADTTSPSGAASLTPPSASSVQNFNQAMNSQETDKAGAGSGNKSGQTSDQAGSDADSKLQELKDLIIQLLQKLMEMLKGGDSSEQQAGAGGGSNASPGNSASTPSTRGGSTPNGNEGGVKPVEGSGPGGSAGSGELIPPPQENIQTLNLGGKQVTVGGDGTGAASAGEVKATADNIQNLYTNSPTFRNMIDSSSDPSFEVSVGRRDDNTSWGNTTGKVFMNLNNVDATNSDTFQSLLGHEFGHASVDLGHGSQMEQTENAVAQEA